MRRDTALVLLVSAALACKDEPKAAAPAPPAPPAPAFTMRDLALATALDARLASFTLVAYDVHGRVQKGAPADREAARRLLPRVAAARGELERAASAVSNPADRELASRVGALAARYADELGAAAATSGPAPFALAMTQARLGEGIDVYRRSRAGWRLEAPEPQGAQREFDETRRELERLEGALKWVAPATVEQAVRRGGAAAERLPPKLRAPAARWVSAHGGALGALRALSQASDARSAGVSGRAYHAAKAESLAALAEYYSALAAR